MLSCEAGPAHIIIPYKEGVELIARELANQLQRIRLEPVDEQKDNAERHYQTAIDDVQKRRKRVQEGFEAGLYSPVEAKTKLTELDDQLENLRLQLEKGEHAAQLRQEVGSQFPDLSHFPEWVQEDDPVVVHRLISALCETITVSPERVVTIQWRQ